MCIPRTNGWNHFGCRVWGVVRPGGPGHAFDKEYLAQGYILSVFKPSVVFLDCREKSEMEIAAQIANALQSHKVAKDAPVGNGSPEEHR